MSYYLFLRKTETTARKRHACIWCGERVEIGAKYLRVVGTFEGDLLSDAYHHECREAAEIQFDDGDWEFYPHDNERPEKATSVSACAQQSVRPDDTTPAAPSQPAGRTGEHESAPQSPPPKEPTP